MCSLLKSLLFISLISLVQAAGKKSKQSNLTKKIFTTSPESKPQSYYCPTSDEYEEAWDRAPTIEHRNPNIWRVDKFKNIIMTRNFARKCPIAYEVVKETSGKLRDIPQAKLNRFSTAWTFSPEAESLMNVLEIALIGYVTDENGMPICWTPSKIHEDFGENEVPDSENWVRNAQIRPKEGLMGHNEIFSTMGIFIRKIGSEKTIIGSRLEGRPVPMTCDHYVSHFEPHSIIVTKAIDEVVLPDSDDEKEETDLNFTGSEYMTDEEFSKYLEDSAWTKVSHPSSKKSQVSSAFNTPMSKSSMGKTTIGSMSAASIDELETNSTGKELLKGAKVEKKGSGSHKKSKPSSAFKK